jgi:hypothetical protein
MAESNKQLFWLNGAANSNSALNNGLGAAGGGPLASPMTIGPGENINTKMSISKIQTINVVKNFNWTNSARTNREMDLDNVKNALGTANVGSLVATAGIPAIILNEYRVTYSSAIANMRYQIKAMTDSSEIITAGSELLTNFGADDGAGIGVGDIAAAVASKAKDMVTSAAVNTVNLATASIKKVTDKALSDNLKRLDPSSTAAGKAMLSKNAHLEPYAGLYLGAPSGFRYVLPYLTSSQYRRATNTWGSEPNQALYDFTGSLAGIIQGAGNAVAGGVKAGGAILKSILPGGAGDVAEGVGNMAGGALGQTAEFAAAAMTKPLDMLGKATTLAQQGATATTPGTSLEETKGYTGYSAGNGNAITCKFFLANTHSFEEVVKNWHLLFLLQYQNLPNKNNKITLEPSVMYECQIPGHYYSPYCYIESIVVTGVGNTRVMKIPLRVGALGGGGGAYSTAPESSQPNKSGAYSKSIGTGVSLAAGVATAAGAGAAVTAAAVGGTHENVATLLKAAAAADPASINLGLPKEINVLIPEAFIVEISFKSMVPDTKNLLFHTLKANDTLYTASVEGSAVQQDERTGHKTIRMDNLP